MYNLNRPVVKYFNQKMGSVLSNALDTFTAYEHYVLVIKEQGRIMAFHFHQPAGYECFSLLERELEEHKCLTIGRTDQDFCSVDDCLRKWYAHHGTKEEKCQPRCWDKSLLERAGVLLDERGKNQLSLLLRESYSPTSANKHLM
jgi:hypothetical protein